MKRYDEVPLKIDDPSFPWTKFKIIAETEEDKKELLEAFEHLHWADIDTGFIAVNHLVHLYEDHPNDPCRIIVKEY